MTGKPVVFHPEALAETEAAIAWYQGRSLHAADLFFAELETAVEAVAESPERWPSLRRRLQALPSPKVPLPHHLQ